MEKLGKYNNITCYKCSDKEYKEQMRLYDNRNVIYIIDGTMVHNGIIVGYYDGIHVRDVYDEVPYMVKHEPAPQRPLDTEPAKSAEVEEVVKEIRFSDYSKVVDEFFALLEE